ncbi:M20 family metallopeptidase [Lichenihabitans sp. Uapishka_5]|uniref:M20 aminoacylase family protein n=1 Tax=Lichenihabitans sp. Uapishka_5 TaxID=3037302 RepID=UPI0029E81C27|nr:M20 aminoacylase family protein [Lichenihabitans sp. Uapishka_5]MDX7953703.1 M20 family metallopeptidase [Lichenihabitans sp. Uapishka_5]
MHPSDLPPDHLSALVALRRDLHAHPEIGLTEVRTAEIVARELASLGYAVDRGLAATGVVGTLRKGSGRRAVGLRADMDALPIAEETNLPYASRTAGVMHACGHDGHTATLLGAAKLLAERCAFDGTVHLIFQPAEENVGGARIMVEEGLFRRFPYDAVYALHNEPGRPLGQFALRDGPIMAAVDEATVTVQGLGGHGAEPQDTRDSIVAGASIVMALQTVVSRTVHPMDPIVLTVGAFNGGSASNVIPDRVALVLGMRSFDPAVRDLLERRIRDLVTAQAASYGCTAVVDYQRSYDATVNHPVETETVRRVARRFAGPDQVVEMARPSMGSEDFAYMLKVVPGSYFFLGAGMVGKPLHHPGFDFNDALLPIGATFWASLVAEELRAA